MAWSRRGKNIIIACKVKIFLLSSNDWQFPIGIVLTCRSFVSIVYTEIKDIVFNNRFTILLIQCYDDNSIVFHLWVALLEKQQSARKYSIIMSRFVRKNKIFEIILNAGCTMIRYIPRPCKVIVKNKDCKLVKIWRLYRQKHFGIP